MKPYTGTAYSPRQVRYLLVEETPEAFTTHKVGRRTVADGDDRQSSSNPKATSAILQPEWTSQFSRIMSSDQEMRRQGNWWHYPVRHAMAKLAPFPEWGPKRIARRALIRRAMSMYLWSNYEAPAIAIKLGIKEHEAIRALQEAAAEMSRTISVFGYELAQFDPDAFASGLMKGKQMPVARVR